MSYPKGKHDDVMDAIWTALDGSKPCRRTEWIENTDDRTIKNKILDWMTL